ncbi:MAG: B12-binding domain-containing protein [Phycisphaerae bacterium]
MTQLTPKQVARAIGVSDASLKRWCDKGIIASVRTVGGHRRIPLPAVIRFLRDTGRELVRPEVLGLPPTTGQGKTVINRAFALVAQALIDGDEQSVQRLVFDLLLAGHSIRDICDKVITPAFREIGSRWQHGDVEVYQERRGVEICLRTLSRVRDTFPEPPADAPLAIGATPETDPYTLATLMISLALQERGWRAENLGNNVPIASLMKAVQDLKPRMLWLSISWLKDAATFAVQCNQLFECCQKAGVAMAVGGHGLTADLRAQIRYSSFCDTLGHLADFADTVVMPRPVAKGDAAAATEEESSEPRRDEQA